MTHLLNFLINTLILAISIELDLESTLGNRLLGLVPRLLPKYCQELTFFASMAQIFRGSWKLRDKCFVTMLLFHLLLWKHYRKIQTDVLGKRHCQKAMFYGGKMRNKWLNKWTKVKKTLICHVRWELVYHKMLCYQMRWVHDSYQRIQASVSIPDGCMWLPFIQRT